MHGQRTVRCSARMADMFISTEELQGLVDQTGLAVGHLMLRCVGMDAVVVVMVVVEQTKNTNHTNQTNQNPQTQTPLRTNQVGGVPPWRGAAGAGFGRHVLR